MITDNELYLWNCLHPALFLNLEVQNNFHVGQGVYIDFIVMDIIIYPMLVIYLNPFSVI